MAIRSAAARRLLADLARPNRCFPSRNHIDEPLSFLTLKPLQALVGSQLYKCSLPAPSHPHLLLAAAGHDPWARVDCVIAPSSPPDLWFLRSSTMPTGLINAMSLLLLCRFGVGSLHLDNWRLSHLVLSFLLPSASLLLGRHWLWKGIQIGPRRCLSLYSLFGTSLSVVSEAKHFGTDLLLTILP